VTTQRERPGPTDAARVRGPSLLARYPESLPVATAVAAWAALIGLALVADPAAAGRDSVSASGGSAAHHQALAVVGSGVSVLPALLSASVMALAMMSPLAIPGVRAVAARSRWWRAGRAALWFFLAFSLGWVLATMPLAVIGGVLGGWLGPTTAALLLLAGCAALLFVPGRRRAEHDRIGRLRDRGWAADADCARTGLLSVVRGLPLCGPPMLAMVVAPGGLVTMAMIGGLTLLDRITEGRRPLLLLGGYAATAATVVLFRRGLG